MEQHKIRMSPIESEASWEKVIEGTKNMVRWKKQLKSRTPHIIFQFLVVKPNEHQIEEVKRLAKELEVNEVALKTAQIYDYQQGLGFDSFYRPLFEV